MEHNVFSLSSSRDEGRPGEKALHGQFISIRLLLLLLLRLQKQKRMYALHTKRGKEEGDKRKIYGRPNPVRFTIDLHIKKGAPETKEGGKKSHGLRENVGSGSVAFCSKMQLEEGPLIIFAPRQNSLQHWVRNERRQEPPLSAFFTVAINSPHFHEKPSFFFLLLSPDAYHAFFLPFFLSEMEDSIV